MAAVGANAHRARPRAPAPWALWLPALLVAACGPRAMLPAAGPPKGAFAWRTMRSEHSTTVTAQTREGARRTQHIRGLVAASRPDRLRLRALGPGGVTLFDLVARDGRCLVVSSSLASARRPQGRADEVLGSLCQDLRAVYRLAPQPGAGTRISFADWRAIGSSVEPFRIVIEDSAAGFTADITVERTTLDEALDPALFDLP
jgi:hypothetical protein